MGGQPTDRFWRPLSPRGTLGSGGKADKTCTGNAHPPIRSVTMFESRCSQLKWMAVNLAGIAVFLTAASLSWIEPELANVPGASGGDAYVWFVMAVPVLVLFIMANLAWLAASLGSHASNKPMSLVFGALIFACWIAAYLFDNLHHGI